MSDAIKSAEQQFLGHALQALIVGVTLMGLDDNLNGDGLVRAAADPQKYLRLLKSAIADIRSAAINHGVPPEVIDAWGPISVNDAAAAEQLRVED